MSELDELRTRIEVLEVRVQLTTMSTQVTHDAVLRLMLTKDDLAACEARWTDRADRIEGKVDMLISR